MEHESLAACRLCMRPGDMPLDEWVEAEANNDLPTDREYVVEAILDERRKRGKREFIVKWEVTNHIDLHNCNAYQRHYRCL